MKHEFTTKRELPKSTEKKLSKADEVYDFLYSCIIEGVWSPGERINDKEISEHLGINRLAVREALSRFIQNGIIRQVHWKGYHLREISAQDVLSLVQVRVALEHLAIELFLGRDEAVQEKALAQIQYTIGRSAQLLTEGNVPKYMKVDFHVHELIYKASGNCMIAEVISNTRILTSIMRNLSMGNNPEDFQVAATNSMRDHQKIHDALKSKDMEGAKAILSEHLAEAFANNIIRNIDERKTI